MQNIILKDNLSDYHELIQYPDGQKSIRLHLDKLNIKEPISIKCRIKSFSELEVLSCLIAALRKNDFYIYELKFIYLFGMRSDRAFSNGEPNYFKDVVAPIINSFNIPNILLIEPHSLLSAMSLNGRLITNIAPSYFLPDFPCEIIGGDKSYADNQHYPIKYFDKIRKDGAIKISLNESFKNVLSLKKEGTIVLADDMIDAGGTFIEEAKYLIEYFPEYKRQLFVFHGLFTKGVEPLLPYFDKIYTTNSYSDSYAPQVTVFDIWGNDNND